VLFVSAAAIADSETDCGKWRTNSIAQTVGHCFHFKILIIV